MNELRFEDQVVVVTGAGRGLGAAYARLFGRRGATVIVHDAGVERDGSGGDPQFAEGVANEIRLLGGKAQAATQNLATRQGCQELISDVVEKCGRLDVLVHSAGLVAYHGIEATTENEWERQYRINIAAPFWLCQSVWPTMKAQHYGRVVLTVSGYGLKAYDGSDVTAYGVGKAAQFGLMNGLAGEGHQHGILVNAVAPVAATRMFRRPVAPGEMTPGSVAPGVVAMSSPAWRWTGKVLQAADGRFRIGEYQAGVEHDLGKDPTPEQVLELVGASLAIS